MTIPVTPAQAGVQSDTSLDSGFRRNDRFKYFFFALALLLPRLGWCEIKNPDAFIDIEIGDVDSLDPAWAYDTASQQIIANVYEYLLTFKGSSLTEIEGRLATKVPSRANGLISPDGLTYIFPIRHGVKFQDGTPMTPEDVKYSFLRFMLFDRDGGPSSLLLEPILGISSTRDAQGRPIPDLYQRADRAIQVKGDTVVVKLHSRFSPFLSILANWVAVVSKSWCAQHDEWSGTEADWIAHNNPKKESSYLMAHMNGTGPFLLDRWEEKNKEVVLARNDHYWRKPARLKSVVIRGIEEFATRKLMIEAGDADSIFTPQMTFPQLAHLPGVVAKDDLLDLEAPTLLLFSFHLNAAGNPNIGSGRFDGNGIPPDFFSDKDIRKAIAYSIDYDAYVRDILRGKGRQAHGVIPAGMLGYSPNGKAYRLDPAKAAEHFKKAWGGQAWDKGFQFTLMYNDTQTNIQALCNMIKKNVEALNPKFKIDVRTIQWSTFLDQIQQKKIPLYVQGWGADYPDPHNLIFPLLHSKGSFPSQQGYSNPKMDRWIEEAVSTLDSAGRERLYQQIQSLEYEEVPHILISEAPRCRVQRAWVKGWVFNPVFPDAPYSSYYYDIYKEGQ